MGHTFRDMFGNFPSREVFGTLYWELVGKGVFLGKHLGAAIARCNQLGANPFD
jgi:hypothetical protein